jgi:hypothetical protein
MREQTEGETTLLSGQVLSCPLSGVVSVISVQWKEWREAKDAEQFFMGNKIKE